MPRGYSLDDAGWRLEIKKYPKLTSVGAWRGEGHERVGGYYTQEDIKEIVAYATLRNIDVIPEIEIPAHTLAAIAAYPWLSCTGEQLIVQTQHSISRELYCVGKESTFEFLENVFKETFELFSEHVPFRRGGFGGAVTELSYRMMLATIGILDIDEVGEELALATFASRQVVAANLLRLAAFISKYEVEDVALEK